MTRSCVLVRLVAVIVLWGCAPPTPAAWYDAATDTFHYDDATMTVIAAEWGDPGVAWVHAHEDGHREMMRRWRQDHVALWLLMPGATANIQIEQVAQCLAAASGAVQPWVWGDAAVAAGYWSCPPEYVALVT